MLQRLTALLEENLPTLIAVYRFGSWNTPAARPDSDIDLAVLTERPLDSVRCWELAQALAVEAGRDVDLVDLLSVSTVFRAQIVSNGTRLHCTDKNVCRAFEDRVYSEYARLNEERRYILDGISERGRIHA